MDKFILHGTQTIKNPWFSGLKAVLDYFCENVELQKKVRIVLEYDPQRENTRITYYRDAEPQNQAEGQ